MKAFLRPSGKALKGHARFLYPSVPNPHLHYSRKQYSSSIGSSAARWLSRKFLTVLALAGVSGGALLVVSCSY
jgi:hypothetical protein